MTGQELQTIRQKLGLGVANFGAALGYRGNDNTLSVRVREYERGKHPIPEVIARLALMFSVHGVPWPWAVVAGHHASSQEVKAVCLTGQAAAR